MKKIFLLTCLFVYLSCPAVVLSANYLEVHGTSYRVRLVELFLATKKISPKVIRTEYEVMGELNGKPWPGVRVSTSEKKDEGIFVPISDKALKNGLCDDQKRVIETLTEVVKKTDPQEEKKKNESIFLLCHKQDKELKPPLKIKTSHNEMILNFQGQKEVVMFWLEDSLGRRVFSPEGFALDDGNYRQWFEPRLDCKPDTYIKWWDYNSEGKYWDPTRVDRSRNKIRVSVLGVKPEEIDPVSIVWQVRPNRTKYIKGQISQVNKDDEGNLSGVVKGERKRFFRKPLEIPLGHRLVHLLGKKGNLIDRTLTDKEGKFSFTIKGKEKEISKLLCLYPVERKDSEGNYFSVFIEEGDGVEDEYNLQ